MFSQKVTYELLPFGPLYPGVNYGVEQLRLGNTSRLQVPKCSLNVKRTYAPRRQGSTSEVHQMDWPGQERFRGSGTL